MINEPSSLRRVTTPPAFDDSRLHRERLVASLLSDLDHKLVVVVAAPGFGKSVLLADFVTHTDLPICWLDLCEADQDPMRFAMVLRAALQRRFRRIRDEPDLKQFSGSPPEALARALIKVIEAHIPERFVFVLDDVHLLNTSKDALKLLDTLILESPEQMTFLAAGRALPEVSISRLVVNAQMSGLGADALALSEDEVVEIVAKSFDRDLESDQVRKILDQTGGWFPGVLLVARSLVCEKGDILHGKPLLHEFLLTSAFQDEPADLQEFMLAASVLPEMTAEACDKVLERHDSQKMLERLSRKGLFITTTGGSPSTYVFHDLYRSFLIGALEDADPDAHRRLVVRAADHCVAVGQLETAIRLFMSVGDDDQAASLAEKHAREMFEVGRINTLADWVSSLEVSSDSIPEIHLYLAMMKADIGELDVAEVELGKVFNALDEAIDIDHQQLLPRAETLRGWIAYRRGEYQQVFEAADRVGEVIPQSGAHLHRANCYRLRALAIHATGGDLKDAEEYTRKSIRLMEKTGDEYILANMLLDLSRIRLELGAPREAYALVMRAFKILDHIGSINSLANCVNNLAVLNHLVGNYDEAMETFLTGLQKAHQAANRIVQANLFYGQADLFCDLGLSYQAGELFGRGLSIATELEEGQLIFYGFLRTTILYRRWGTPESALECLRRAEGLANDEMQIVSTKLQRGAIELKQDPEKVEKELLALDEHGSQRLNISDQVFLHYIVSKALEEQGKSSAARDQFNHALDLAGVNGMEQILAAEMFADGGGEETGSHDQITHPVLSVIHHRMEVMRAFAKNFQSNGDEPDEQGFLKLRSLGTTEISINGRGVINLEPLPCQVLFYLAVMGPVSRDVLLEAIWPGINANRTLSSLYNVTHNLRTAIMDNLIKIEANRYQINPEIRVKYDIHEFEKAAEFAEGMAVGDPRRFFALDEALNAYKGSFLLEFSMDWILTKRRALERRYIKLLSEYASEALARGNREEAALESLRKALSLEPLRDDLNMRYLELLGQMGRRNEAVTHYQQYCRLLAEDLGLDPSSDMRDLYGQIIR